MSIANTIPVHISTQYVTADLAYRHILEHQEAFCRVLTKHGYSGTYSFHAGFDDETTHCSSPDEITYIVLQSPVSEKVLVSLAEVADPHAVAIIPLSDIVSSTAEPSDEDHAMEANHCHGEGQGGGASRVNGSDGSEGGNSGNGTDGSGDGQHDGSDGRGGMRGDDDDRGFQEGPDPDGNDPGVDGDNDKINIRFLAKLKKAGRATFLTRGAIDIKLEEGSPQYPYNRILRINTNALRVVCGEKHYATRLHQAPFVREQDTVTSRVERTRTGTASMSLSTSPILHFDNQQSNTEAFERRRPPWIISSQPVGHDPEDKTYRCGEKWEYELNIKAGLEPVAEETFDQRPSLIFTVGRMRDALQLPKLDMEAATHWSFRKRGLLLLHNKLRKGLSTRELSAHLDFIHKVILTADLRRWDGDATGSLLNKWISGEFPSFPKEGGDITLQERHMNMLDEWPSLDINIKQAIQGYLPEAKTSKASKGCLVM
ncbi:hypothetical protein H0H92_004080 [Tricholoma furcatifolium]|nr:hypothetical protein H0H92_004080 [Tricholoma furcatifolium]